VAVDIELGANGSFEEERSVEVVNARMGGDLNPRLQDATGILVKHLHAAVKEIAPDHDEWFAAIRFLTDAGHMCSDWRQEFILLSDVLGVTMLVDAINHRRPNGATPNTILGPFYVEGAPQYPNGANICLDSKGEPTVIVGRVVDMDGAPVPGATLDVWQTNDDGFYDVQQTGLQPKHNLRGRFIAEVDGRFWFKTVKPRFYPIPDDGPVGRLLRDLGRHPNRAAHLHFIVTAPGYQQVVTHIFTPDCPYLTGDTVFGVKRELVADFRKVEDPAQADEFGMTGPFLRVDWDFVLAQAGPGG